MKFQGTLDNAHIFQYNKKRRNYMFPPTAVHYPLSPISSPSAPPPLYKLTKSLIRQENLLKFYHSGENMKLSVSKLSDAQVKSSEMYGKLVGKIKELEKRKNDSAQQFSLAMRDMEQAIEESKQSIHENKYDSWELRNEIISLQQQLNEEISENHHLHKALYFQYGDDYNQQQDFDGEEAEEQEDQSAYGQGNHRYQDGEGEGPQGQGMTHVRHFATEQNIGVESEIQRVLESYSYAEI